MLREFNYVYFGNLSPLIYTLLRACSVLLYSCSFLTVFRNLAAHCVYLLPHRSEWLCSYEEPLTGPVPLLDGAIFRSNQHYKMLRDLKKRISKCLVAMLSNNNIRSRTFEIQHINIDSSRIRYAKVHDPCLTRRVIINSVMMDVGHPGMMLVLGWNASNMQYTLLLKT